MTSAERHNVLNTKKLEFNRLFPFAVCLFKLHLNHTATLRPNFPHHKTNCALVACTSELKTAMSLI